MAGVVVAAFGLVPTYYDTFIKDDKSPQPTLSPTRAGETTRKLPPAASSSTPAVKVDSITFPGNDGPSMVGAKPLAKADVKPLINRLNKGDPLSLLRSLGNTDVAESTISLHISGGHPTPVRIINMHAVARCHAPLHGVLFYYPSAGATNAVKLGFNLDEPDPSAREIPPGPNDPSRPGEEYFANHEYVLSAGEPAIFTLSATTSKNYCEFHFVMDLLVDGKSVHQNIDNDGKPFRVSAPIGRYDAHHMFSFDFSSYQMFLQSPIVPPIPASGPSWQLGDPRHPPPQ